MPYECACGTYEFRETSKLYQLYEVRWRLSETVFGSTLDGIKKEQIGGNYVQSLFYKRY